MSTLKTAQNQGQASELFHFTQGIEWDKRLARQEIKVQKSWAAALARASYLSREEALALADALEEAYQLMELGEFSWRIEDEDIHMNLERFLSEKLGDLGKKIHLGRSRNDLIATTLRLHVANAAEETRTAIAELMRALLAQAENSLEIIVPGLTHLQNGQPIRLSHFFLAHAWALHRDYQRCSQIANHALANMPLGSAALAGTSLPLALDAIAEELGFASGPRNSYDSVADRDFLLEALQGMSLCAIHLSRLAEDIIYWSSSNVRLLQLPKDWSTGSSIMPNKRNPDLAELVRAKSAHVLAAETNACALTKALPSSYNTDLHELKSVYFRSFDQLAACLRVLPPFMLGLAVDKKRALELLGVGHILATEFADALTQKGMPFRQAYQEVAAWVAEADAQGIQVHELSVHSQQMNFADAVERRASSGGTALRQNQAAIQELQKLISS